MKDQRTMSVSLTITRDGKTVHTWESNDPQEVARTFARVMLNKLQRAGRVAVVIAPCQDIINIYQTWPNDEVQNNCRYHYTFVGVKNNM